MVWEFYILRKVLNRRVARSYWPVRSKGRDRSSLQLFCPFSVLFWKGASWLRIMSLKMPPFVCTLHQILFLLIELVLSAHSMRATFHVDARHGIMPSGGRRVTLGGQLKLLPEPFPGVS